MNPGTAFFSRSLRVRILGGLCERLDLGVDFTLSFYTASHSIKMTYTSCQIRSTSFLRLFFYWISNIL